MYFPQSLNRTEVDRWREHVESVYRSKISFKSNWEFEIGIEIIVWVLKRKWLLQKGKKNGPLSKQQNKQVKALLNIYRVIFIQRRNIIKQLCEFFFRTEMQLFWKQSGLISTNSVSLHIPSRRMVEIKKILLSYALHCLCEWWYESILFAI